MLDARSEPASMPSEPDAEVSNADAYFEVKATPERATLLVKSSLLLAKIPLTPELVREQIAKAGVTACIHEALINEIAAKKLFDKTHIVASAKPAVHGKDARIEEVVKVDADITPKMLENGKVDYKNVDNIHTVQAGAVLAVKHPATPGEPGSDVFGKATPAKPGKDVAFKIGANVNLSPDGLQLIAAKGGFLYHQASVICIGEAYEVKGDVGFKTGNIRYHGTVHVQGNVGDGFAVEADHDISIDGTVDGSNVTSNQGGIVVKQSFFGHGRAQAKAKTGMHLQAVQDAALECEGEIEIHKLMRNCRVRAGALKADAAGCLVQGGAIRCTGNVALANVGGEGLQTEILVVDGEMEKRRDEMKARQAKVAEGGEAALAMEKRLKGMKALAEKAGGRLTERMAAELKGALGKYTEIKKSIEDHKARIAEIQAALSSPNAHTLSVSIRERVLGSVKISLYGHAQELTPEDGGKRWVWTEDGVAGAGL